MKHRHARGQGGPEGVQRRLARRVLLEGQHRERRQRPAAVSGAQRGAALVGDQIAVEAQGFERRQHALGWRGQQGVQALVGDLVVVEDELMELAQLAQARGQGGQPSPVSPIWLPARPMVSSEGSTRMVRVEARAVAP